jgi:lysine-arginine-ornithine-binding protein
MRYVTRLAVAAAAIVAVGGAAVASEWTTVRIGTEGEYPPFNYFDANNELQGFDIDIAKALCERMEVECVFVAQDWDGIIPALLANRYDAIIASMSITEERQRTVAFTDYYYNTGPAVVVNNESGLTDPSPEGLAGHTVGAQSATTHASYLEDVYTGSTVRLYASQEEANLDLASGRLDAVMADSVVLDEWLKGDGADCCTMLTLEEFDQAYFGEGAGIALRQEDEELKEMFNQALAEILADGTYREINDRYFDFPVHEDLN